MHHDTPAFTSKEPVPDSSRTTHFSHPLNSTGTHLTTTRRTSPRLTSRATANSRFDQTNPDFQSTTVFEARSNTRETNNTTALLVTKRNWIVGQLPAQVAFVNIAKEEEETTTPAPMTGKRINRNNKNAARNMAFLSAYSSGAPVTRLAPPQWNGNHVSAPF